MTTLQELAGRAGAARRGARRAGAVRRSANAGEGAGHVSDACRRRKSGPRWPRLRRARPYGVALLKAIAAKQIPTTDLSADLVRQLHNLKDDADRRAAGRAFGDRCAARRPTRRSSSPSIASCLPRTPDDQPDRELGRAVFAKTCQQCHTLYGVGANIGPDLTGSNRADVEYLLSNIVDPERAHRQGVSADGRRHGRWPRHHRHRHARRTTRRSRSARRPKRSCCPRTKSTSAR